MLLEEFLKPLGMTQTGLAARIGVPINRVNEIIKGSAAFTAGTALRLERLFGMDAQFWLNLQVEALMPRGSMRRMLPRLRARRRRRCRS